MKKLLTLGLLLSLIFTGCSSSNHEPVDDGHNNGGNNTEISVHVETVDLDQSSLTFYEDDEETTLTATVLPSDADNKELTWSSSEPSVATVDDNGTITPVKPGNAVITATSVDGSKKANCAVTVNVPNYVLHGLYRYETEWTDKQMIYNDKSESEYMLLGVQLYKDDVFKVHMYGDIWYGASQIKSSVHSGLVSAAPTDDNIKVLSTGIYDIYSSYNEFEGGHIYLAKVGSIDSSQTNVPVSDITLNRDGKYLQFRHEYNLTAKIYPNHATNKKVYWYTSDESICRVTSGGRVIAKEKSGTATITARTEDGNKSATCLICVSADATPAYFLTGRIGGRSYSYGNYAYAALPLGSGQYFIPNVDLVKGDEIKIMLKDGSYLHSTSAIGNPVYTYETSENKSVNMYLDTTKTKDYLTAVNRASRDIYINFPSDTNNDGKCAWIWVSGPEIESKWIKSNSLISGSRGSRFNISKFATSFTFVRASQYATPNEEYSSIGSSDRTFGPVTITNDYEYTVS
ncbi:MAG: Ig-like domain-containing protein [Bacilli bacterium]|nr:Ig-like domain-containing protein [Bacilli bacterium]